MPTDADRTASSSGQSLNRYQGHFPDHDAGEDAFPGIAPVAQFPSNGYGLYDVGGNVWEWVSDWYSPRLLRPAGRNRIRRPQSTRPSGSFDASEPGVRKRVHRGGSFLCTDQSLLPLHGWDAWPGGYRDQHESSRIPMREIAVTPIGTVCKKRLPKRVRRRRLTGRVWQ